ncbi:uncharacterized protein LOC134209135 [Armigeres subalbatus]|uniref:uncharacterized protein LOC134209135 n=1 Tax=Armigeres subalbatus TaxID=124917 RepID=UPI002ED561D7
MISLKAQPLQITLPLLITLIPPLIIGQNLFGLAPSAGTAGKKKLIVHRVGQCPGQKHLPIFLPDMRVAPINATNSAVSGIIEFREDFPNGWDVSATVKKCDDFRSAESCRTHLNNMANTNQCMLLRLGADMMWMKYLKSISPKPMCPFRKGNYTYGETLVDDELVKYMPVPGNSNWEVEITGKAKNQLVLCIILQFQVRPKKGGA